MQPGVWKWKKLSRQETLIDNVRKVAFNKQIFNKYLKIWAKKWLEVKKIAINLAHRDRICFSCIDQKKKFFFLSLLNE